MIKHIISILTLLVVSSIAILSLLFDTRLTGRLTTFGYVVAILTGVSLILGMAAKIHEIREEKRKQAAERAQQVEQTQHLGRIESEVKASTRPLLPIAIFHTIRHTANAKAVDRTFSGVSGFRTLNSNKMLKLVGSGRLGAPLGYNAIEATALESHCVLEGDDLVAQIKAGGSAIREPVSTILEFFLPVEGRVPSEPNLILEKTSTGHPDEVQRLELFDNVIFQDSFVRNWTVRTGAGQTWSIESIHGARVRFILKFVGELGPVALHDLQLFFGPRSSMHGIHFPEKPLADAAFKDDPDPVLHCANDLAKRFFAPFMLEYECILSDTVLSEHLVKVV